MLFQTKGLNYLSIIQYPDITIPKDQVTFIAGESGSGKSTLLKLLNNTISPTEGAIHYLGHPIEAYDPIQLRQEVALVSQEAFLFEGSILDNFETFFSMRKESCPTKSAILEVCQVCGIDFSLDKDTQSLSGGERHRVYTALFLAFKPKVLMLDEPTAALDQKKTYEMIEGIKNRCKESNMTLIVISHDPGLVERYSEYTILLKAKEEVR